MLTRSLYSAGSTILLLLVFSVTSCHAQNNSVCVPSSCGNIKNITFPFRLKGDPRNCGNPNFELDCRNNQTVLNLNSARYYVQSIDYDRYTIRVVDSALEKNNPCSFPLNSTEDGISSDIYSGYWDFNIALVFIRCLNPVNSSRYVDLSLCSNRNGSDSSNSSRTHSYIAVGDELSLSDLEESCSVEMVIRAARSLKTDYSSLSGIHQAVAYGIELSWIYPLCAGCYGHGVCSLEGNSVVCRPYPYCYEDVPLSELGFRCQLIYWGPIILIIGGIAIGSLLGLRFLCGFPCLIALLVYKWRRRRNLSKYDYIEDLFEDQINFTPIRYSYSEVKKMTNNFKERLGIGAYGTVFKGKLRSGPPIAVKILDKSTSCTQEFVSVVAALGKIRHDDVLQLIGFCLEGEKRALVYDFMPKGSLQQYINVPREGESFFLSYEKMFEISLGVACGIDHLHQNCDMHTSHFGIKPHNVLFDENLTPKISDFGLVKLYPVVGNMAPEFYYKNLGSVSYKADVYSYGILLMEMVSKSKNVNSFAEHINPDHFPSWVHDQLNEGKDMEIKGATIEEMKKVKKMTVVALWCIQMLPDDRPPMNKVVEMLEGDAELLQMPPKPFVAPKELVEDPGMSTATSRP